MSAEHPVFKRPSRLDRIIRRRSVGFQTLVFSPNSEPPEECKVCARWFELYWTPYMCHMCGLWTCESCSSVIERERAHNQIQFVRCCADCLRFLNSWMPNPDELADFTFSPWLVESTKCSLSLNLAEVLQTKTKWRRAAVDLLERLGRPVGCCVAALNNISEDDWQSTAIDAGPTTHSDDNDDHQRYSSVRVEGSHILDLAEMSADPRHLAQFLVQQCYEVELDEIPLDRCHIAEIDGRRSYPLVYDYSNGVALPPDLPDETARRDRIRRYNLVEREIDEDIIQLICHLAGKELNCKGAIISTLLEDKQLLLNMITDGKPFTLPRSSSISPYMFVNEHPLLVRNSRLDVRFRMLPVANATTGVGFVFTVPIRDNSGTAIAMLSIVDGKPRKNISTMEYTVVRELAGVLSHVLTAEKTATSTDSQS